MAKHQASMVMTVLDAIQKKVFVWRISFWGEQTYGWHYDLLFLVANLVFLTTGGGRLVLL